MSKREEIKEAIFSAGLLPLFFHPSEEISAGVLSALYEAGVRAVEYTNRGEEALNVFTKLKSLAAGEMPGMYLGIGTVKNAPAAELYAAAGADFIISPGLADDVFRVAGFHQLLHIPGCMTPSEIMRAEALGADMVKLFPGNVLGPGYVSAIRELFPRMSFMPTGGVDTSRENISDWFTAGVAGVGMGSKLLSKKIMQEKNYAAITTLTKSVLRTIAEVRETLAG